MPPKHAALLLLAVAPALLLAGLLAAYAIQWRKITRVGRKAVGEVIEIRTVKGGRSKSIAPVVEVNLPDGKSIAVRTGEQNVFTRYQVGQTVPVIVVIDKPFLRVYINTTSERLPPLLLLATAIATLAAVAAVKLSMS